MNFKKVLFCLVLTGFSISSVLGHAVITYPKGGESFFPSSQITIQWEESIDHGANNWDLYYSLNGGATWMEIALDVEESVLEYTWSIPIAETSDALVKVIQDNVDYVKYEGISSKFSISANPGDDEPDNEPPVVTGLEDVELAEIELTNFPNPFSDFTTIQFSIPASGDIELKVYSIDGKIVLSSSKRLLEAGTHKLIWKSVDLPGGMYLCKFTFGGVIVNRKMILSP
jgi:hypothetical protein